MCVCVCSYSDEAAVVSRGTELVEWWLEIDDNVNFQVNRTV